MIIFIQENETRDHVEVSPQSGVIMQHIASRLEDHGGIVLVIDYGHDGTKTDTFRVSEQQNLDIINLNKQQILFCCDQCYNYS